MIMSKFHPIHLLLSKQVEKKISTRYNAARMNLTPILTYPNCWLSLFCAAVIMDTLSSLGTQNLL